MQDPHLNIYAAPQRFVKVGRRRRLNLYITGSGSPTVILSAGGAGSTLDWLRLQPLLSETNRVVSYDRAGMGFSDPGPLPRTTSRSIADLRIALKALNIEPPYVLVGHSTGSLDVRLFAFQHPEEVAGIVLVDPRGDRMIERLSPVSSAFAKLAHSEWHKLRRNPNIARRRPLPGTPEYENLVFPAIPTLPDELNEALRKRFLSPSFWRTAASEWNAVEGASQDELCKAHRHLGDIPLIVLTAERNMYSEFDPSRSDAIENEWRAMHDELVRLSSRGVRRDVKDCGHNIQGERPDTVVQAVKEAASTTGHSSKSSTALSSSHLSP